MSNELNPRVEIFVLNYNGLPYLEQTLRTVIGQSYHNIKVILSDDNSKDLSVERANLIGGPELEVRVRVPGTGNVHPHCNICIGEATAPYIGLFHADDLYDPQIVEKQVAFLNAHPDVDVVLTAAIAIDSNDEALWPMKPPAELKLPVFDANQITRHFLRHGNSFFVFPSALYRRSTFEKVGTFRTDLKNAGDLEMWMRILSRVGKIGFIDEPLIFYRLSLSQGSSAYDRNRVGSAEFFQVMDEYLTLPSLTQGIADQDLKAYSALRSLDRLQIGLNLLSRKGESKLLFEALDELDQEHVRASLKNFGGVDRIKIAATRLVRPGLRSSSGPRIARWLIEQTDPRSGRLMRTALKLKRMVRPT